jgi:hypothetical protein
VIRRLLVLLLAATLAAACGGGSPPASHSSPTVSGSTVTPSGSPSASATIQPLTGSYGLLLSAGSLELIKPDAGIAATVPVATASVQFCSALHDGALEAPPVSASSDQVYFRDGDNKIKMVVPPAGAVDVTTVPGSATTVSFFSVSPDDQRIAVLVEDLSGATTISLRLYVEDLHGGNHADIYTTTTPKGKGGTTLWPMGWHAGALVLALVPACTFEPAGLTPSEWHVSNAATALRMATIRASNCTLSFFPSPAGVGCISGQGGATTLYNWSGKVTAGTGPPTPTNGYTMTGLSPAGQSAFFATGAGIGAPSPETQILQLGPGPYATVQGHAACLWIDEDHLLAPDAVIRFPAETPGNVRVTAPVTALAQSGVCVGRFPGTL